MSKALWPIIFTLCALWHALSQAEEVPDNWPTSARQDALFLTAGVDPFPILLKRAEQIRIRGTAILVPDAGKIAISPEHMMFLRQSLAQLGWDTLLLTPPEWPDMAQSQEGWKVYQLGLQQRMQASLEKATELPGNKLIIAEGASAASLLNLYRQGQLPPPSALVVISPYLPDAALNHEIAAWYGLADYPLLDVYTPFDNRWAQATVTPRAIAAQKRVRLNFRQLQMSVPPPNPASQHGLTRKIHGWIDHLGW